MNHALLYIYLHACIWVNTLPTSASHRLHPHLKGTAQRDHASPSLGYTAHRGLAHSSSQPRAGASACMRMLSRSQCAAAGRHCTPPGEHCCMTRPELRTGCLNAGQQGTQSPNVCGEAWALDQKATLKAMADQGAKTHRAVGSRGLKHWSPPVSSGQHSFSRGTCSVASTTALPRSGPYPLICLP